ncbi:MAG: response regulator [Anaerolineae bacterium]|jgi:CheY-like chemotaxis protein|nr:response regulator [Anaerolineae bacterium]MBT7189274.1 response regulator [Anaerolineae bacterium]MBT7990122.1 response regulator [Anaerolineae bacterium]
MKEALVIDDNRKTADALVEMVSLLGVAARPAYGSSPAMALLGEHTPSLILLDVNMPGVDGFEILAYLRREPRLMNVPVIVVTSDDQPETRKRVMDGGAETMIIKPASLHQLESALRDTGVL